jgi:UrcA family protein
MPANRTEGLRAQLSMTIALAAVALLVVPVTESTAQTSSTKIVVVGAHDDQVPTARVLYGDLDLTHLRDRRRLSHRIRAAVSQVCPITTHLDLAAAEGWKRCHTGALRQGNSQMRILIAEADAGIPPAADSYILLARAD